MIGHPDYYFHPPFYISEPSNAVNRHLDLDALEWSLAKCQVLNEFVPRFEKEFSIKSAELF